MANQTTNQFITQQTALPEWYVSYLNNVMGRAVGAAGEPYQPYGGPTVAGLTPDQLMAYNYVQNMQGMGREAVQGGLDATIAAGDVDSGAAGAGSFGSAADLFGRAGSADTAGLAMPWLTQGRGYLEQGAGGS